MKSESQIEIARRFSHSSLSHSFGIRHSDFVIF
jgi:hypothetical protein